MQEWDAVFLEIPRLYESADIIFRGKKCQTSHISSVETVEGTEPMNYRVKTMTGSVYIGPVATEETIES